MADSVNILDRLAIPDLMGKNFFIPDYQRGYRWDKLQVFQLISDIDLFRKYGKGAFYCLQPIIVKECDPAFISKLEGYEPSLLDNNRWYEVIDGQQRLTTIRLILAYNNLVNPLQRKKDCFKLFYQTRPGLGKLFDSFRFDPDKGIMCDLDTTDLDIDSFHVLRGLNYIHKWFSEPGESFEERSSLEQFPSFMSTFYGKKLEEGTESSEKSVQVLWYELKDGTNPQDVFKRLNDNKIELTNSELIRALFLSSSAPYKVDPIMKVKSVDDALEYIRQRRQAHISEQWDLIEHKLRDDNFWAFITNYSYKSYSCRIEFLFDLISQRNGEKKENPYGLNPKDSRYTYLFFDRELEKAKKLDPSKDYLWDLWSRIETYFTTLSFWFEDRNLYHWIGYLIRTKGDIILPTLLEKATSEGRQAFEIELITMIIGDESEESEKEDILGIIPFDYHGLSYDRASDTETIEDLLCLYNIETYRCNKQLPMFPFKQYKDASWTLEHIHAQNSEGLPKDDNLILMKWLEENISALEKFRLRFVKDSEDYKRAGNLIVSMQQSLEKGQKNISHKEVSTHFDAVLNFFNSFCRKNDMPTKIHELSNMTLLSGEINTAVGKSAFEIKRQKLVRMDAEGKFIPYCTKKVFMKYCNIQDSDFEVQQTSCWDDGDKINYQEDIDNVISNLKAVLKDKKDQEDKSHE